MTHPPLSRDDSPIPTLPHSPAPPTESDERQLREEHLVAAEERHRRDPAQEQLRPQLRGTVPQRLHDGAAQARREAVLWPARGHLRPLDL